MLEWSFGPARGGDDGDDGQPGLPEDEWLRDHAAVFCEMEGGGSAVLAGQRMLPDTKGADYRIDGRRDEGLCGPW